jgi:hypothetical protein
VTSDSDVQSPTLNPETRVCSKARFVVFGGGGDKVTLCNSVAPVSNIPCNSVACVSNIPVTLRSLSSAYHQHYINLTLTESLDNTLKVENTLKPFDSRILRKIFDTREINKWKLDDITLRTTSKFVVGNCYHLILGKLCYGN